MCLFLPDSSRLSATPVEQPSKKVIDQATRSLIDRLLLERISLASIARAAKVSEQWLLLSDNTTGEKYQGDWQVI
jgi:AraC-like DNA-binding protein